MNENTKKYYRQTWIDALKGIAICGVIMIHSGGAGMPSILGKIGAIGQNGVQLFFLLSSYLAFVSFEHNVNKNGNQIRGNIKWVIKKFIRLIPLYYLSLLVCGVFQGGSATWLGSEGHIKIGNVISHITFTHGFFPHYTDSIIAVEWYLGVLAVFYIFMPLLFKWINTLEKSIICFIISGFTSYLLSYIGNSFLIPNTDDAYIYSSYFGNFWFVTQFPVIILGIVLYYIFKSNILEKIEKRTVFSYILLLFSVYMIFGMALGYNNLLGLSSFTLFGIWFLILAISQKLNSCIFIDNKLFVFLGKHSYPIYLFHFFLVAAYGKFVPTLTENMVVNWLIKYLIIVIVSSIIAIPLEKYFDAPIVKKLNKIAGKI
jgi:peptidoglycan/LPS O-acetylase OafA/YrhL